MARRRRRPLEHNYLSRVPPDQRRDAVGACKVNSVSIPHNVSSSKQRWQDCSAASNSVNPGSFSKWRPAKDVKYRRRTRVQIAATEAFAKNFVTLFRDGFRDYFRHAYKLHNSQQQPSTRKGEFTILTNTGCARNKWQKFWDNGNTGSHYRSTVNLSLLKLNTCIYPGIRK